MVLLIHKNSINLLLMLIRINKGFNPLFLSVGALKWKVKIGKDGIQDVFKDVYTPLILFPIQLIRGGSLTAPVSIGFVNTDIYLNPVLYYRIKNDLTNGEEIAKRMPHPNYIKSNINQNLFDENKYINEPINIDILGDGKEYFDEVKRYINEYKHDDAVFEFDENIVAFFKYNHGELCMYYDIKNHEDLILEHPLVKKMFNKQTKKEISNENIKATAKNVLEMDSIQNQMISDVINGESMIIKGPPGTGKTQTITNMIVSLLEHNKKVLVSSKKLAALSEVYAKVPENIRHFLLLLDSESETEASKKDPKEIKDQLENIINKSKKYQPMANLDQDMVAALKQKDQIEKEINNYINLSSMPKYANKSYYDVINEYLSFKEIDENIPNEVFINKIKKIDALEYKETRYLVEKLNNYFVKLTNNYEHAAKYCPWLYISNKHNLNDIANVYQKINNIFNELLENINKLSLNDVQKGIIDNLSLYAIYFLGFKNVSLEIIENVYNNFDEKTFTQLKSCFKELLDVNKLSMLINQIDDYSKNISLDNFDFNEIIRKLKSFNLDENLTNSFIRELKITQQLIDSILITKDFDQILFIHRVKGYFEKSQLLTKLQNECIEIFKDNLSLDDTNKIISANKHLHKYLNNSKNKISLFDISAKKALKQIRNLFKNPNLDVLHIVYGCDLFNQFIEAKNEIENLYKELQEGIFYKYNENEFALLNKQLKYFDYDVKSLANLKNILNVTDEYLNILNQLDNKNIETVKNVIECYKNLAIIKNIKNLIEPYYKENCYKYKEYLMFALKFMSIYDIKLSNNMSVSNSYFKDVVDLVSKIEYLNNQIKLDDIIKYVESFQKELIDNDLFNYYSKTEVGYFKIKTIKILQNEFERTDLIDAAKDYQININNYEYKDNLPINDLFEYLINSKEHFEKEFNILNLFEHLIYKKLIKMYQNDMNLNFAHSVSFKLNNLYNQYENIESEIRLLNQKYIERSLYNNINKDIYLHCRSNDNIRQLFNNNANAIMALKKCLILSPATASLLFTKSDIYNNFDVVIVDEASQLEPVEILPILFRAKQCVIVGDEWQMPPIEHFKTKRVALIEDYDAELVPDSSVLSQFLNNNAFKIYELECHYRSRTESLIRFSQHLFYPKLKTFPAPEPKKDGLGFVDKYIANGFSNDGRNLQEAEEVVNCIKKHFDKYFQNNELLESLGIVAFGEKQIALINEKVEKDVELNKKIKLAIENRKKNVVPEKVIFFKTIEDVQGQEADHLILSLTYGKNKDGKTQLTFGQLNRDKLGKCIFNVAVTRARSSITVIHSIKPNEIDATSSKIGYIKDYLEIVEKFAQEENQFVCSEPNNFVKDVGNYILSLGYFLKDRLVYNYGVTDGSIRIPIAILSKDKTKAVLGIFCEREKDLKYNYIDYNIRYFNILKDHCGWNIHRVFASDWVNDKENVCKELKNIILKYLNL